ncbi:MAG: sn-glycerol-3-phosphate ABC transporter ATP-binding protein UgpC [Paracoccaceae bacterium]
MSDVLLKNITKKFGSVTAINGVNSQINSGEFCVLVGPSGCGKSTLLRMIAGLEGITSGDLLIGGKNQTNADPAKRGVAMVFQTYALYPHMTVKENMSFGLKMVGTKKQEIERKVSNAAKILGLEDLLDRRPKALSGGQRQRVAIGRAIVREPKVFLFDEPLSNLDAELRVQMRLELSRLHARLKTTMIYVTHDQVEAMTLADKIIVMKDGNIEQFGAPDEIYSDPKNLFVAQFIGSPKMNILNGVVTKVDQNSAQIILPDFPDKSVIVKTAEPLKPSAHVKLGIRPEHFGQTGSIALDMVVSLVENLGDLRHVHLQADGLDSNLCSLLREKMQVTANEKMVVRFDPKDAFLFDSETGQRLR